MGRKTTLRIFQDTSRQNQILEDLDMTRKGKIENLNLF